MSCGGNIDYSGNIESGSCVGVVALVEALVAAVIVAIVIVAIVEVGGVIVAVVSVVVVGEE